MYKMDRVEIQRGRYVDGNLVTPQEKELMDQLSGRILDVHGGMGLLSEYLSNAGCDVTLIENEHLSHSYRRNLCKDSKVTVMRIDASEFKLNSPLYDYIIVRNWGHLDMARQLAKVGVVNLLELKIEKVNESEPVNSPEVEREDSEDNGDIELNEES